MIYRIDDIQDRRLSEYYAFNDKALFKRTNGCFVETLKLVERALANGYTFKSLIVVDEEAERWEPLVEKHFSDIPVYLMTRLMFKQLIKYEILTGLLGIAHRKPLLTVDDLLQNATDPSTLLICSKIKEPTNLGSLMRVAAAFGVTGLILGPGSCDPWYRRSSRVSMGTCYRLPIVISKDLTADINHLKNHYQYTIASTILSPDALPLHHANRPISPDRLAIMLGHEVYGIPQELIDLSHQKLIIPMQLGTDSLNISVSASVFLYHFIRPEHTIQLPESMIHDADAAKPINARSEDFINRSN